MDLDEKTIMELASQLGIEADRKTAVEKAKSYEKKSDGELLAEIRKLQDKLNASSIPYEKQLELVESLMPMMNPQQKARLAKIAGLMKK
ncbi:MAG: hypothetical protein ACI4LA_09860 [Emergencia sp.]